MKVRSGPRPPDAVLEPNTVFVVAALVDVDEDCVPTDREIAFSATIPTRDLAGVDESAYAVVVSQRLEGLVHHLKKELL